MPLPAGTGVVDTAPTSRAVGVLIFLFGVVEAFAKKRVAGDNPWGEGANTLEWQLSSPPPLPPVGTASAHQVSADDKSRSRRRGGFTPHRQTTDAVIGDMAVIEITKQPAGRQPTAPSRRRRAAIISSF